MEFGEGVVVESSSSSSVGGVGASSSEWRVLASTLAVIDRESTGAVMMIYCWCSCSCLLSAVVVLCAMEGSSSRVCW